MKRNYHHLNYSLCVVSLTLLTLVLAASCGNGANRANRKKQQCGITPALKKAVKKYKDVHLISNGLIVVGSDTPIKDETGRSFYPQGCIDMDGNVIVPVKYDGIRDTGDGTFIVTMNTNQGLRFGLLDNKGNVVAPIEYELILTTTPSQNTYGKVYTMDFFTVKKNGLTGVMAKNGNIVIPIQYEKIWRFYIKDAYRVYEQDELPDVFLAQKSGKLKVFNLSPEKMKKKPSTPYDVTLTGDYGKQSLMDYEGRIIAGPFQNVRFRGTTLFQEGLAAVVKNNKIGFIDMQGNVKIPFKFYYSEYWFNYTAVFTCNFSEGLAPMINSDVKWGYIDKSGNLAIPFVYDEATPFHKGSALVAKGNLLGMIDKNNNVILPFEFENGVFTGNVYAMCQNNKWGIYSSQGKCITPCQYDQFITFVEGYATVVKDRKQGLIDEMGQVVIPCEYKFVLYDIFSQLVYVEKENGKRGYVDLNNQEVFPIEFDEVTAVENGQLFYVKKDGRYGFYDRCGNSTLD